MKYTILPLFLSVALLWTSAFGADSMERQSIPIAPPSADSLYYSEPEKFEPSQTLDIQRPPFKALIQVEKRLDPYQLDAASSHTMFLADTLDLAMENNLDLTISKLEVKKDKWKLWNSYSQFLPDGKLAYNRYQLGGHIRLPTTFASLGAFGPLPVDSPFTVLQAGINYKLFQGGKVLFTALQSRNIYRASKYKYHATLNDTLLESTRRYYNLLLNEAILQIRIKAVRTSEEQLQLNKDLEQDGKATRLDVLQAQTQLSDDRQNLFEQQIARRDSAIQLAEYLDMDTNIDIEPADSVAVPVRLLDENVLPGTLIQTTMNNRPELKDYREQWLASRKAIWVAAAPLYPTVQIGATEYGVGQTLSNQKQTVIVPVGVFNPITLGAAPIAETVSRQVVGLGVLSVSVNWDIHNIWLNDATNVAAARVQARQALLQSNKEVNTVISQVRQSYLSQISAFNKMNETTSRIRSSAEELRLAQLRLQAGLDKNIDVLKAQQDYTNALVEHARSIIDFNIAQAQLLHDLGIISRENLLTRNPLRL